MDIPRRHSSPFDETELMALPVVDLDGVCTPPGRQAGSLPKQPTTSRVWRTRLSTSAQSPQKMSHLLRMEESSGSSPGGPLIASRVRKSGGKKGRAEGKVAPAPLQVRLPEEVTQRDTAHIYTMLYEEQRKLGAGGAGTVWKVKNRADGQFYAAKKYHGTQDSGDMLIMQYDHPNIVRYYGCFSGPYSGHESDDDSSDASTSADINMNGSDDLLWWETQPPTVSPRGGCRPLSIPKPPRSPLRQRPTHSIVLVMQYYERGTLRDYIDSRAVVDVTLNLKFLLQMVAGVQYLHKQGVIHRDLKPSNVFLASDNTIKIGDFDLATQHHPRSRHSRRVGTPTYASPEQWVGHDYSFATDVWSLGVILFELFCDFRTTMERDRTLTALRKSQIIPPSLSAKYPRVMALVQRLVCYAPSQRLTLGQLSQHIFRLLGKDLLSAVAAEAGVEHDFTQDTLASFDTPLDEHDDLSLPIKKAAARSLVLPSDDGFRAMPCDAPCCADCDRVLGSTNEGFAASLALTAPIAVAGGWWRANTPSDSLSSSYGLSSEPTLSPHSFVSDFLPKLNMGDFPIKGSGQL